MLRYDIFSAVYFKYRALHSGPFCDHFSDHSADELMTAFNIVSCCFKMFCFDVVLIPVMMIKFKSWHVTGDIAGSNIHTQQSSCE